MDELDKLIKEMDEETKIIESYDDDIEELETEENKKENEFLQALEIVIEEQERRKSKYNKFGYFGHWKGMDEDLINLIKSKLPI